MKKVLVTGFQPFGGEKVNPSYEAVKMLPDKIDRAVILRMELPTVFHKSIAVLKAEMAAVQPDIVVCVGQAGGRYEITPERVAINVDDARMPDNEGVLLTDEPIFSGGPAAYFTKLPIKAMVQDMKIAGIPAAVSNSAGTYVCNHIMYGLLYLIERIKAFQSIRGGFIHVPFSTEQVIGKRNTPSLTLAQISRGLEISIESILKNDTDIKAVGGETH